MSKANPKSDWLPWNLKHHDQTFFEEEVEEESVALHLVYVNYHTNWRKILRVKKISLTIIHSATITQI